MVKSVPPPPEPTAAASCTVARVDDRGTVLNPMAKHADIVVPTTSFERDDFAARPIHSDRNTRWCLRMPTPATTLPHVLRWPPAGVRLPSPRAAARVAYFDKWSAEAGYFPVPSFAEWRTGRLELPTEPRLACRFPRPTGGPSVEDTRGRGSDGYGRRVCCRTVQAPGMNRPNG